MGRLLVVHLDNPMIAPPLRTAITLLATLLLCTAALPQQEAAKATPQETKPAAKDDKAPPKKDDKAPAKEEKPKEEKPKLPPVSVTDGSLIIAGHKVEYRATAGTLSIADKTGKAKANMFYMAYNRKTGESPATRRLTFCFNGGPGSASAYVHLGFFGPRRILMGDDGLSAPTPAQMVENDCSILDVTDMVFIDPVSTGYSRAENANEATLFHGLEEDTQSVGDFIREYVNKFDRKESPVYIAGESYGTTRSASLSTYLQGKKDVKLAGIVLISCVLDFQTIRFGPGNELPYALHLPTYTATAYHHGKLDKRWATDLQTALKESQKYADGPYLEVLHKGNLLTDYERQAAAKQLAMLTGLSEDFVLKNDLRIEATRFRMELLRDKEVVVGRLDSRVASKPPTRATTTAANTTSTTTTTNVTGTGTTTTGSTATGPGTAPATGGTAAATPGNGRGENRPFRGAGGDPSQTLLSNLFTEAVKTYLPDGLGYKTEARYTLTAQVQPWSYGQAGTNRYANVAPRLRAALEKDRSLRVLVCNGYCDLATPHAATVYTFAHMGPRELMNQITMAYYDAGHMMYTHEPSRRKLREDIVKFMTAPATTVAEKK
jgi:carboxypeptidase C (cathepsin A)